MAETENKVVPLFDAAYGNFETDVQAAVRRGAFGEDIGQNSWLTADEWRRYLGWLELSPASELLDIASGGGGPATCAARELGCRVVGVEKHATGVATAQKLAAQHGLGERVRFLEHDATLPLPFPDASFDAITCIDSMLHFPDRGAILAEWRRVLRPGGHILYTDPIVVTGMVTNEELFIRSSIGFFLFTAVGVNDQLIATADFELVHREDVTEEMARVARRWLQARSENSEQLVQLEGSSTFEGQQRFFAVTAKLSAERRLSRFVFHARARR